MQLKESHVSFIRSNPFGHLCVSTYNYPDIVSLPFILLEKEGQFSLECHIPKSFPIFKTIFNQQYVPHQVSIIFSGPNGYISSEYYERESAPTWNFEQCIINGMLTLQDEANADYHLEEYSRYFESLYQQEGVYDSLSEPYIQKLKQYIAPVRIEVLNCIHKIKLSHEQPEHVQDNIISSLKASDKLNQQSIGRYMEKHRKSK